MTKKQTIVTVPVAMTLKLGDAQATVTVKTHKTKAKLRPKHLFPSAVPPETLRDDVSLLLAKAQELGIKREQINQTVAEHLIRGRHEAAQFAAREREAA